MDKINIKIFDSDKMRVSDLTNIGYENIINNFCDSVNVIDIVVVSTTKMVVKYIKM